MMPAFHPPLLCWSKGNKPNTHIHLPSCTSGCDMLSSCLALSMQAALPFSTLAMGLENLHKYLAINTTKSLHQTAAAICMTTQSCQICPTSVVHTATQWFPPPMTPPFNRLPPPSPPLPQPSRAAPFQSALKADTTGAGRNSH